MADDKGDKQKSTKTKAKSASAEGKRPATKQASAKKSASRKPVAGKRPAPKARKKPVAEGTVKRATLVIGTTFAKAGAGENWCVIDATDRTLGRLSSYIAMRLMGKLKATYTPSADTGDHVVVVNAEKVKLTGKKWDQKTYYRHSNYPGGIHATTAKVVRDTHPERLIQMAVWRMLPKAKGHMARHWFGKLRVYAGAEHPHHAQKPTAVELPSYLATK